jgi:parafibromin
VVAVIASGQAWQFKGWKWKFPVEVFKKGTFKPVYLPPVVVHLTLTDCRSVIACGFHVYTQGSILSEEIKQWDVKILMIHPDKRHLDKVASKEFWRNLFEFLKMKLQ